MTSKSARLKQQNAEVERLRELFSQASEVAGSLREAASWLDEDFEINDVVDAGLAVKTLSSAKQMLDTAINELGEIIDEIEGIDEDAEAGIEWSGRRLREEAPLFFFFGES
jgi:hypothetical protein